MRSQYFTFGLLLILCNLNTLQAIWFPWYFYRYAIRYQKLSGGGGGGDDDGGGGRKVAVGSPQETIKSDKEYTAAKSKPKLVCPPGMRPKNSTQKLCEDNPILMQLARLYVVSPERIVLLLSQPSLQDSCAEVNDVVNQIELSTSNCEIADDNIFGKLTNGLQYFKAEICDGGSKTNKKRCLGLKNAHDCIRELRADMIECEAPADWYERKNTTKVCQTFNDIINCYYTRAAMLCGVDVAHQLRSFAGESMQKALIYDCPISTRLPRVEDPMPIKGAHGAAYNYLLLMNDQEMISQMEDDLNY